MSRNSKDVSNDEGDVGSIIAAYKENPAAWNKFRMSTPASVEGSLDKKRKKAPAAATRTRGRDKKAKKANDSDKDEHTITVEDSDDETPEPPRSVIVYPKVPKPLPVSRCSTKAAPTPDYADYAPFTFTKDTSYEDFLIYMCTKLHCGCSQILAKHELDMRWRPHKPQSAKLLVVGGSEGYDAMKLQMFKKKDGERNMDLVVPMPAEVQAALPEWMNADEKPVQFDYGALIALSSSSDSVAAQMKTINAQTKHEIAELEKEYPIGKHAGLDPQKRYYLQPVTNYFFELNNPRMGLWANAMAAKKDGVDMKNPPQSLYFDGAHRVKHFASAPAAAAGPSLPFHTNNAPAPPLSRCKAPGKCRCRMAPCPATLRRSRFRTTTTPLVHHPAVPGPPPAVPAPSSPVKRHNVSLEQFCEYHDIVDADRDRLKNLGMRLGGNISSALDKDLIDAGFTKFGWDYIFKKNSSFKKDLAAGVFGEQAV
ncbi:hypothetical protein C8F01DRAFT_1266999 [Mycena amicta]|nr:hypothetical protein C8F01DRAFT_1266999 [Mycena amicta]